LLHSKRRILRIQWLRLALSKGSNTVGGSPHLRAGKDPVSETSCFSSNYFESWRWTKSENPVFLCEEYFLLQWIMNIYYSGLLGFWTLSNVRYSKKKNTEHSVLETGSVFFLRWGGRHLLCWVP
jgi:hypothetical protein